MLTHIKIDKGIADAMRKMQKAQEKVEDAKEEMKPLLPVDPKLPTIILSDVDRTLATRHKGRGIFEFEKALDDEPVEATVSLLKGLADLGNSIFLITGRESKYRDVTEAWLNKHRIERDQLLMRQTGDFSKADIMKENLFVQNIAHKFNVLFVLEDDPIAIKMFRRMGLYVLCADISRG